MKVSLGGLLRCKSTRAKEQCFSVPTSEMQKVQRNLITAARVLVSPQPMSVLINQTALTYIDKISSVGPCHLSSLILWQKWQMQPPI